MVSRGLRNSWLIRARKASCAALSVWTRRSSPCNWRVRSTSPSSTTGVLKTMAQGPSRTSSGAQAMRPRENNRRTPSSTIGMAKATNRMPAARSPPRQASQITPNMAIPVRMMTSLHSQATAAKSMATANKSRPTVNPTSPLSRPSVRR